MGSLKAFIVVALAFLTAVLFNAGSALPYHRVDTLDVKELNCSFEKDRDALCCDYPSEGYECRVHDASPGVRVEKNKIVFCFKKTNLLSALYPERSSVCYSCTEDEKCVVVSRGSKDARHLLTKRVPGNQFLRKTSSLDPTPSDSDIGSHFLLFVVTMASLAVIVFLVVLCAGGGEKGYEVQTDANESTKVPPSGESPKGEEVQEVQLEIGDPPQPERLLQEQAGDQINQEEIVLGQPEGIPPDQAQRIPLERPEGVPVEQPAVEQPVVDEPDDDPAYDRIQGVNGNHGDPQGYRNRNAGDGEGENGVKVSYGRVSRHPGQPPYASVSDVLPQAQQELPRGEVDEEGYDHVVRETDEEKDDYAEVPSGLAGSHSRDKGDGTEADYDVVGYDSVQGPNKSSASQEDEYDVVRAPGVTTASQEEQYEVVPDSVKSLSTAQCSEVAPQLPPMRTRQQSGSEDDHTLLSGEHKASVSGGKDGRKGQKEEKKGKHHQKDGKDKGSKGFPGIFRHRSQTIGTPSRSKISAEPSTEQGPPLPPNHPQPHRTATGGPLHWPTPAVPRDEVEDFYDEPFDSAPAGRPRKVSSSTSKDVASKGSSHHQGLTMSGSVSPASKGFPQTPLPQIPPTNEEVDPNYESVTPTLKKVVMATPKEDEEETPYDTVATALGIAPLSTSKGVADDEGEVPYDVVARIPGTGLGVSVSALGNVQQQQQDEEETPYDTVERIPGTSLPISTSILQPSKKESTKSEDPYSTIKPKIDTSSDVHPYASINKARKKPASSDDPYSMPVDTIAADHDELGYAVVSEEFKRARTMSKEATAMKKIAKKKPSNLSEDPYSTIDSLVTGSSDDPSSPPPISPIKDDEIIQGFSPPPTPPPLAVSPEGQLSQVSDSCQDDIKQVWKYEGCESGGEILEGNHLTHDPTQKTNGESPCDPVDEGNIVPSE
jgi:hypothetical protein